MALLEVEGLKAGYGELPVLQGISFAVEELADLVGQPVMAEVHVAHGIVHRPRHLPGLEELAHDALIRAADRWTSVRVTSAQSSYDRSSYALQSCDLWTFCVQWSSLQPSSAPPSPLRRINFDPVFPSRAIRLECTRVRHTTNARYFNAHSLVI